MVVVVCMFVRGVWVERVWYLCAPVGHNSPDDFGQSFCEFIHGVDVAQFQQLAEAPPMLVHGCGVFKLVLLDYA